MAAGAVPPDDYEVILGGKVPFDFGRLPLCVRLPESGSIRKCDPNFFVLLSVVPGWRAPKERSGFGRRSER